MKDRFKAGPLARRALVALATGCSAAGWAAPLMSVEAQALAHWVHYTRLHASRQQVDAPFIVVDADQLRWWLVDATGRRLGFGPVLTLSPADRLHVAGQPGMPEAGSLRGDGAP